MPRPRIIRWLVSCTMRSRAKRFAVSTMMAGRTPNLDKLAKEGMLFTDYYAEASCTAGRANFVTGMLPIRTGMTTVGQAGASVGLPAEAVTIATVLQDMGYATGQFGKNDLGDMNEFLRR